MVSWLTIVCQVGIAASTLLVSPRNVYRKDGTPVMIEGIPTWKDEVMSIFKLVTDWKIMILTPAFLASNWQVNVRLGWQGGPS